MVDFFCYREKESSDEGTQESIKVREKKYKKTCLLSSSNDEDDS